MSLFYFLHEIFHLTTRADASYSKDLVGTRPILFGSGIINNQILLITLCKSVDLHDLGKDQEGFPLLQAPSCASATRHNLNWNGFRTEEGESVGIPPRHAGQLGVSSHLLLHTKGLWPFAVVSPTFIIPVASSAGSDMLSPAIALIFL